MCNETFSEINFNRNVFWYLLAWQYISVWMFSECHLLLFSSKGEECDDMNSVNGDGCSSQCKKEPFFNCIGKS